MTKKSFQISSTSHGCTFSFADQISSQLGHLSSFKVLKAFLSANKQKKSTNRHEFRHWKRQSTKWDPSWEQTLHDPVSSFHKLSAKLQYIVCQTHKTHTYTHVHTRTHTHTHTQGARAPARRGSRARRRRRAAAPPGGARRASAAARCTSPTPSSSSGCTGCAGTRRSPGAALRNEVTRVKVRGHNMMCMDRFAQIN